MVAAAILNSSLIDFVATLPTVVERKAVWTALMQMQRQANDRLAVAVIAAAEFASTGTRDDAQRMVDALTAAGFAPAI